MKKNKTMLKLIIVGALLALSMTGCQTSGQNESPKESTAIETSVDNEVVDKEVLVDEKTGDSAELDQEDMIQIDPREMISGHFDGEFPMVVLDEDITSGELNTEELLVIALDENPSTGYHWEFKEEKHVNKVSDKFVSDNEVVIDDENTDESQEESESAPMMGMVGVEGVHYYGFKIDTAGNYKVQAVLKSPAGEVEETKVFELNITKAPEIAICPVAPDMAND